MKRISILLLITLSIFANQSIGQDFKYVNADILNIRKEAGSQFDIVRKAEKGDKVNVISTSGDWSKIQTEDGIQGYVKSNFLTSAKIEKSSNPNNAKSDAGKSVEDLVALLIFFTIVWFFRKEYKAKSSSPNKEAEKKPVQKEPQNNYQCKNCRTLILSKKNPNNLSCPRATFHDWINLGEAGSIHYQCKNCGTLINSKKMPNNLSCPSSTFHDWSRL